MEVAVNCPKGKLNLAIQIQIFQLFLKLHPEKSEETVTDYVLGFWVNQAIEKENNEK
jgi:hypothetical protein